MTQFLPSPAGGRGAGGEGFDATTLTPALSHYVGEGEQPLPSSYARSLAPSTFAATRSKVQRGCSPAWAAKATCKQSE